MGPGACWQCAGMAACMCGTSTPSPACCRPPCNPCWPPPPQPLQVTCHPAALLTTSQVPCISSSYLQQWSHEQTLVTRAAQDMLLWCRDGLLLQACCHFHLPSGVLFSIINLCVRSWGQARLVHQLLGTISNVCVCGAVQCGMCSWAKTGRHKPFCPIALPGSTTLAWLAGSAWLTQHLPPHPSPPYCLSTLHCKVHPLHYHLCCRLAWQVHYCKFLI